METFKTRRKSFFGFAVVLATVFSLFLSGCKASVTPGGDEPEKELKQYTVTFVADIDGEAEPSTVTVKEGKTVERPANPEKTGFSFDGWYTDEELSEAYDFATPVTSDFTLYAKWNVRSFSVKFETDGGTAISEQTVEYNSYATKPSKNPEKQNCTFNGWFKDAECKEKFNFRTGITADTVIYAGWTFLGYKVTFETNGGSAVSSQSILDNGCASEPKEPSMAGYSFSGWYTDQELTAAFDFTTAITANITLYAKWTIKNYTVSFYSDSSTVLTTQSAEYGSKIAEPEEAPVKEHYTFAGWYKDITLLTPYDFDSTVTGDISLYAKWNPESYTVTFIYEGETISAESILNYLSTVNTPKAPSKTGYTFGGWYSDADCTIPFDFSKGISSNTTIYAKWTINTFTVKFVTNGGSEVTSATVNYNASVTAPANPTKEHYTFDGWYKDSKLRNKYDFKNKVTEDLTLYAKWNAESYTVTFNSNGGTEMSSSSVEYNTTVRQPASPEKTGYTFNGWYTDSELTAAFNFTTRITANTTLYAKYTINTYTVTFNSNGGSEVSSATVEYNGTVTKPADPSKQYYTFGGWYTDTALSAEYNFTTPVTQSIALYAKWNAIPHTVTFNTNGGDAINSVTVNEGSTLTVSPQPVKTGYTFKGWFSDSETTQAFNFSQIIVKDVTLYAKWEIAKYTVSFFTDGGTAISSQTIEYGKTATRPATDPAKQNCDFKGWFTSGDASTPFDFSTAITASTTVYAGWDFNGWVVRFNTNGAGTIASQVVKKDGSELVSEPAGLTKNHYIFSGWYEDPSYTTSFNFSTAPTSDKNLYAKWTPENYSISFYADGSLLSSYSTTADYNTTITLPAAPAKAHYTFDGWYTDTDYRNQFTETTKVTGNTSLYAKYSAIMWTVTFNTDGGSSIAAKKIMDGDVISEMPADPTKTGYTFAGWYKTSNCNDGTEFDQTAQAQPVVSNITLYAKWNINYYRVEFNVNGGTYVNLQNVQYNSTVSKPADPTLNHKVFGGWYTDAACTTAYNFNTKVTKAMTLYAKWTDLMRTVTFNSNGGSTVAAVKIKDGEVITTAQMPAAPTREGYSFDGWYTDSEFADGTEFDQTEAVQNDITLYAKWNINTFTVTFNSNGGSAVSSVTVNWNTTVAEPAAPTKAHMIFAGWYSNEQLTSSYNFGTAVKENKTIYAKWTPIKRTITFNVNGGSSVSAITFDEGTTVTKPENPEKDGYAFGGWYTDQALTKSFYFATDSEKLTENITLYAKWINQTNVAVVIKVDKESDLDVTITKDSSGNITFSSVYNGSWSVDMQHYYSAGSFVFEPSKYEKGIYVIALDVVIEGKNYSYTAQVEVQ